MKINISVINLQSGVATRGLFHYLFSVWKYWLPHSDKPILKCGEMIKEEGIDVACITEISEKSLRSGFRSQTNILQRAADMQYAHFFSSQLKGKFFFHEGNAVLSDYPLSRFSSHLMPIELMRMGLEETTLETEKGKITIFLAHLALGKKMRLRQIEFIKSIVNARSGPMIFAGDFNEADPSTFDKFRAQTRLKQLCTAKTFPSWKPFKSLDYVLLTEDFKVDEFYAQKSPPFSDHLALVVKAELQ